MEQDFVVPLVTEGLSEKEIELAVASLRSGIHTMGKSVERFENEFAKYLGVEGAVMVNSGSSANLLALEAILRGRSKPYGDIEVGSFVAVPSILWPTTLWPVVQLGLRPLLIDTKPESLEIDLEQLILAKESFGDRLVGAIVIHPLGKSIDLVSLKNTCQALDIFLIEDTCESLGSGNNDRFAGTVGIAGTYSFYYSHHITTIEGGMVVADNKSFLNDLRSMRAHGWTRTRTDKDTWISDYPELGADFLFVTSGFNFRPMEIQGVLGLSQLNKFPNFLAKRLDNVKRIHEAATQSELTLIGFTEDQVVARDSKRALNSWMTFPFLCKPNSRLKAEEKFRSMGIATRPLIAGPFWNQPAFSPKQVTLFGDLTNARFTVENSFMIGNHHSLSEEQVQRICDAIRSCSIV